MIQNFISTNKFRLIISAALAMLAIPQAYAANEEKPADFAYSAVIKTEGNSAHYHVTLPLPVYLGSQSPNLNDLRVFNAKGEAVPYALSSPRQLSETEKKVEKLSWFPLSDNQPENIVEDVVIERNASGGVVSIKAGQSKSNKPTQGLLLDTRSFDWPLAVLKIQTEGGENMQHFSVETSDDLKVWRTLLSNGLITRLEHDGQRLIQDEIKLPATKASYIKITWAKNEKVPEVVGIEATFTRTQQSESPFIWSDEIKAEVEKDNTFKYSWQTPLPVERVDVLLPEVNTLAQVSLESLPVAVETKSRTKLTDRVRNQQDTAQPRRYLLTRGLIYRLTDKTGEVRSTELSLGGSPILGFILSAGKNTELVLGKTAPNVKLGFTPKQLVFLARGEKPFTLVWGKKDAPAASLALNVLAPQHNDANALPGDMADLEAVKIETTSQNTTPQEEKKDFRWLLWGVLVAGVLLLLGMAWKLIKS